MRAVWCLAAVLLAGCPRPATPPPPPPPLRLVVLIVVDQLPAWSFERDSPRFKGGFARLLRDGAVVPAADIPYANTFTAPGHAAIGTGAAPSATGIVGNAWYRRADGGERAAEYDPDALPLVVGPALGKGGLSSDLGASGRALRVDGVADVLRRTGDGARSVAISFKARAACLVAGRHPDLAIWFEPAAGGMTTSRAYADEAPQWLVDLAKSGSARRYLSARWEPRDPEILAQTGPDDAPGEGNEHGLGPTFPHALEGIPEPDHAIAVTPFADEIEMETVAAALDGMALGKDDATDLLAISFSAHDLAGHQWGPDSWEELDLTLRLDDALGRLFDTLDHRVGKDRWAVVLTSDHGVTPLVEHARDPAAGSRRIKPDEIEQAAERGVEKVLGGKGKSIAKLSSDNLYATHALAEVTESDRQAILDAVAASVAEVPQVAAVFRTDKVCGPKEGLAPAACLATVTSDAGEWLVFPAAGSTISPYPAGTGHDAPFDDNRKVPILVMAPGLHAQRGTGSLLQVAPTLSALLGISPPEAATMPPLFNLRAAPARTPIPPPAR